MSRLKADGLAAFRRDLSARALKGAEAAAEVLREKLSGPGSGVQYPGHPNPASRESEYPAEQTGELRESIGARPAGDGRAQFGSIDDPPEYAADLHFKPPDAGGRPFMDDALHDRDIHRAALEAMTK